MRALLRWAVLFKLVLFFLGTASAAWFTWEQVVLALGETEPTPFAAADLPRDYRGQQWLELKGTLAFDERAFVADHPADFREERDPVLVFVPLVPAGWKPRDPVHAVVIFGPALKGDLEEALRKAAARGRCRVRGVIAPAGTWPREKLFPDLRFAEPALFLNEGMSPAEPGSLLFVLILFLVFLYLLTREMRFVLKYGQGALTGRPPDLSAPAEPRAPQLSER